ncbi:MAG: serine hydrolase [Hylemonella sp.]|nr:serine hydrolase [Hylemonella sp.]
MRYVKKLLLVAVLGVVLAAGGLLWRWQLPSLATGVAAKAMCSAAFVAQRPEAGLFESEVAHQNPLMLLVHAELDAERRSARARFLGFAEREARWLGARGCVLEAPADAAPIITQSDAGARPAAAAAPWPLGDAALPPAAWGPQVDAARLQAAVARAMDGAGDSGRANPRAVAVVQGGRLLLAQYAPGFAPQTALHGWSMTKTVTAMLTYKLAHAQGWDLDTPVVQVAAGARAPAWLAQWRNDGRGAIRVSDLMAMRDGLQLRESYEPGGEVPHMLWLQPDMPAWVAAHPAEAAPATRWRYLSASSNLMAATVRSRFADDPSYWTYPQQALFDPLGMQGAVMETDTAGNWVGSSYLWARLTDWARLGELTLRDGRWGEQQVLPPGWRLRAATVALPEGEGRGYGAASTWRFGDRGAGKCRGNAGVPEDVIVMSGHWGQMVAVVPSLDAVVVRMGWVHGAYDQCAMLQDMLAALRQP